MKDKEIEYIGKGLLINTNGKRILVIGDLHLGYEEALVSSGIAIGKRLYEEMIEYFDKVFEKIADDSKNKSLSSNGKVSGEEGKLINSNVNNGIVDEIVLLGDVKHVFGNILSGEWNEVLGLFDYLEERMSKDGKIVIVKGNHDAILEPIAKKRKNVELVDYYVKGDCAFAHGNKAYGEMEDKKITFWILGHGHPAIKISDRVKIEKYKCFLEGQYKDKTVIILPSFISANEGSDPRENNLYMGWDFDLLKFNVWVVSEDLEVLDFGKLRKIK